MHSQQSPGVVQNWSTLQRSKHDIEQCGYDHAPVTRGRMRTQFPLPHGHSPLLTAAQHPRHGLMDVRSLQRFPAAIAAPKRGPCGCRSGAEGPKTSERIIRRGRGRGGGVARGTPPRVQGRQGAWGPPKRSGGLGGPTAPNSRRHAHGAGQSNRGPTPLLDPSKDTLNAVQNLATTEKKRCNPPCPVRGMTVGCAPTASVRPCHRFTTAIMGSEPALQPPVPAAAAALATPPPLHPPPPSSSARRSRSSAVMHVTPELEVLGSNPSVLGARVSVTPRAGRDAARDR